MCPTGHRVGETKSGMLSCTMTENTSMLPGVASIWVRRANCSCNRAASLTPSRTASLHVDIAHLTLFHGSPRFEVIGESCQLRTISIGQFGRLAGKSNLIAQIWLAFILGAMAGATAIFHVKQWGMVGISLVLLVVILRYLSARFS